MPDSGANRDRVMARLQNIAVVFVVIVTPVPAAIGLLAAVAIFRDPDVQVTTFNGPAIGAAYVSMLMGLLLPHFAYEQGEAIVHHRVNHMEPQPIVNTVAVITSSVYCALVFYGIPTFLADPSQALLDPNRSPVPTASSIVASLTFGALFTLFLFRLGYHAERRRWERSSLVTKEASRRLLRPRFSLPSVRSFPRPGPIYMFPRPSPIAWGFLVGVGTFCGIAVGIYTSSAAVQLLLALAAALAAGLFAVRQL